MQKLVFPETSKEKSTILAAKLLFYFKNLIKMFRVLENLMLSKFVSIALALANSGNVTQVE